MARGPTLQPERPTIQEFSSAYDMCELRVRPEQRETSGINDATYRRLLDRDIQHQGYRPVFGRLPGHSLHLELVPDTSVPLSVLELPFRTVERLNVSPVPSEETVLVATARHAVRLNRLSRRGDASLD